MQYLCLTSSSRALSFSVQAFLNMRTSFKGVWSAEMGLAPRRFEKKMEIQI